MTTVLESAPVCVLLEPRWGLCAQVSRVGGSGISIARSSDAKVVRAHVFQVGANGLEFSRVEGASLSQSVVTGYGLVLMGAAAVELDQSPAIVEHNVSAATVGLGLGCCRDV